MKTFETALAAAIIAAAFPSPASNVSGWAEGAEEIEVAVTEERIDCIPGIVYRQVKRPGGIRQLRMTVLSPRNSLKKPAVIFFPGGGFRTADYERFIGMRLALARAGFVVAGAEYRPALANFPAMIEDAKAAVRYLRSHAVEYGIDPERIGVFGDSAGGYIAAMMGVTNGEKGWDSGESPEASSDVQASVSIYGLANFLTMARDRSDGGSPSAGSREHPRQRPEQRSHGGASIYTDREQALFASPISHIDGSEPPMLLMHGTDDHVVSPLQSRDFYEALKAKKVDVRYVIVRGAGHADGPWFQKPVIDLVAGFFREKLGVPRP